MTNENEAPPKGWSEAIEWTLLSWEKIDDDAKDNRIEELEDQLKTVLDRESATHLRHDAKTDKLEALIAELEAQNHELHMQVIASDSQAQMAYEEQGQLEAKLARVIEVLERFPARGVK